MQTTTEQTVTGIENIALDEWGNVGDDSDTSYDAAATYIRRLTGNENTPVTWQTFDDCKADGHVKRPHLVRTFSGTLHERYESLRTLNRDGAGVFVTVNETDGKGRKKPNIIKVRAIWSDDDHGALDPASIPLRPQMVTETSPGKKQVYVLTTGAPLDEHAGVMERMVKSHHCDPGATGINRVLRVPGFFHMKYPDDPHLVQILHMTDDPPYPWESVLKGFPPFGNGGTKAKPVIFDDPVYRHLNDHGWVKQADQDGKIHIRCPFENEHTTGDGGTSTTYFIPFTNGYKQGHFKCQHGHCAERTDADFLAAVGCKKKPKPSVVVPSRDELKITEHELSTARLTPRCIVQNYLYADVATLSAPGGTGKTTITIYEAIHIVLGRQLYGLDVPHPGWCLFVTAEDSREILVARLREVARAMDLLPSEMSTVLDGVLFWDVSGQPLRLISMDDGNIILTETADAITAAHKDDPPAMVLFDPIVSFGVGESRVNDNEQGLIMAARRIRNGLRCAVRTVNHTGQVAAREKQMDQYASRGGTALPDGSRMSYVLQPWTAKETKHRPPQGCVCEPGSSITILARPKLSYAKPNLPLIWIKRTGWDFEHFTERIVSDEERDRATLRQVDRFLLSAEGRGTYHNKTSLQAVHKEMGLKRQDVRDAIDRLLAEGRVTEKDLPEAEQSTRRKTYLSSRQDSAGFPEKASAGLEDDAPKTQKINAAAYRENPGGIISRPDLPVSLNSAAESRQDSAGLAGLGENNQESDHWEVEI